MNIHDLLSQAVNKKVVYSRAGGGAVGIWHLELEGEMNFMFYCAWRIEQNGTILSTDYDDVTPIVGHMNQSVEKLIGAELLSYELSPHNDLTLFLDKGFVIEVFCNSGFEQEFKYDYPDPNWDFAINPSDIAVTITTCFQPIFTKCSSNEFIKE